MEPGPGVLRSGIGGGAPLTDGGRLPKLPPTDGFSSVGLPRDEIDERAVIRPNDGRHTFCRHRKTIK